MCIRDSPKEAVHGKVGLADGRVPLFPEDFRILPEIAERDPGGLAGRSLEQDEIVDGSHV